MAGVGWRASNSKVHGSSGAIRRVTGQKFKVHCADEVVGHDAGCASNFRVSLSVGYFRKCVREEKKMEREEWRPEKRGVESVSRFTIHIDTLGG